MAKTYPETLHYLYHTLPIFQHVGAAAYKNDLTNTYRLCEILDNPQQKFKSIHVAGTNGKGSTSHMLAAILQCAGYKTGLYTSPHLKEFTERIKINGVEVEKEFVIDIVNQLQPALEQIKPSFFEMTVAMAFEYFSREAVDIAVIEVGLGGRLDSTNVITPVLSVITNISFDHQDILGDTLEKIAFEKAGVIKPDVPVVISERQFEVEQIFTDQATQRGAPLTFASEGIRLNANDDGFDVYLHDKIWLKDLTPELKGNYQQKNIPGVLAAVLQLRGLGFDISDSAVRQGIASVVTLTGLKGRWQKLRDNPLTICDTGHNADGIKEVVAQIQSTPHRHLHFVFGVVKEKERSEVLKLLPKGASYYFCQARIPRALDATLLAKEAYAFGLAGKIIPDVNDALREATLNAEKDDLVFIGGSTFVVAEIDGL